MSGPAHMSCRRSENRRCKRRNRNRRGETQRRAIAKPPSLHLHSSLILSSLELVAVALVLALVPIQIVSQARAQAQAQAAPWLSLLYLPPPLPLQEHSHQCYRVRSLYDRDPQSQAAQVRTLGPGSYRRQSYRSSRPSDRGWLASPFCAPQDEPRAAPLSPQCRSDR